MIDLTPVLQALVALIATIITALIIPYIKSKTDTEQLERMKTWVALTVKAAEQIFQEQGSGELKKAYVRERLEIFGVQPCEKTVDTLIESAVNTLKSETSDYSDNLDYKEADNNG